MSSDQLERFDRAAARIEKLLHWQIAIVTLTAAGVLWGARIESNQASLSEKVHHHEDMLDKLSSAMQTLALKSAVLEQRIDNQRGSGASNKTDIRINSTNDETDKAARARGYYTTSDVAAILKKSERTVSSMCAAGEIPNATQPENGRGWRIPLGFLIGAATDEEFPSGNQSLTAANNGSSDNEPKLDPQP